MKRYLPYIFWLFISSGTNFLFAQEGQSDTEPIEFIIERSQPITIDLEEEEDEEVPKKKRKSLRKMSITGLKQKRAIPGSDMEIIQR
jgi:hypothetical protein